MVLDLILGGKAVRILCSMLHCCLMLCIAEQPRSIEELSQSLNVEKQLLTSFINLTKFIVEKDGVY